MLQEKILQALKQKHNYVSGEELSDSLKVSRQALWKHIQELRDAGYDIVAVPHLGYQLVSSPDLLLPSEISHNLHTKFIGRKIYYFEQVPSTMDIATELGLKGAPGGTVVLAEAQSKGRGRMGREWHSPKHKGIYLSLILRPKVMPQQAPVLTLLTAVSVCEAIREVSGLIAQIKWPNDLLINQKKLGGILTEINAETDQVHFVVIGIGLNVNNDKKSLIAGATSLSEQKKADLNRIQLLQEILRRMEKNYLLFEEKGARPIIEKWEHFNITLGRHVKVVSHREQIEGQAVDIDRDGALLLRKASGLTQRVTAGDVVHCR